MKIATWPQLFMQRPSLAGVEEDELAEVNDVLGSPLGPGPRKHKFFTYGLRVTNLMSQETHTSNNGSLHTHGPSPMATALPAASLQSFKMKANCQFIGRPKLLPDA